MDLFGGSGSTLVAAEQTGRKAFLMELDAPYCDVIVERWQNFTGKKAEREPASVDSPRPASWFCDRVSAPAVGRQPYGAFRRPFERRTSSSSSAMP